MTMAGGKSVTKDFVAAHDSQRRASLAIGLIFVGVVLSLVFGYLLEDRIGITQGFMVLFGVGSLGILGWPSAARVLGGSSNLEGWSLAVFGGGLALLLSSLYTSGLNAMLGASAEDHPMESGWWAVVLFAPLVEEWLMRGVAWVAMTRIGGPRSTILVTSALFALMHGLNGGAALEYPHRFLDGLIFGWLRWKTGSLGPPVLAHMVLNAAAVWWLA